MNLSANETDRNSYEAENADENRIARSERRRGIVRPDLTAAELEAARRQYETYVAPFPIVKVTTFRTARGRAPRRARVATKTPMTGASDSDGPPRLEPGESRLDYVARLLLTALARGEAAS